MSDRLLGLAPPDPAPLYQKTDHWFQRATAALLGEVPCRLGCTSCCIGPFPITLLDVQTLQQGLAGLPPDDRHRIEQRAIEHTAAMETAFPQLTHRDLLDNWSDQEIDRLVTEFHNNPCPALETDGRCGVYQHRPLVCRSMGIPTEDRGLAHGACEVQTFIPILRLRIPKRGRSLSAGRSRRPGCASSGHRINRRRGIPALRVLSQTQAGRFVKVPLDRLRKN
jgi:Fe-S-cluster containining protein